MKSEDEVKPFACSPRLPDLESRLVSALDALDVAICSGGSLFDWFIGAGPDCPPGVASLKDGGIGFESAGTSWPSDVPFTTGRALGLGGIASPRAGLRGPPRPPGTGGRNKGAGLDIVAGVFVVSWRARETARMRQMRGVEHGQRPRTVPTSKSKIHECSKFEMTGLSVR